MKKPWLIVFLLILGAASLGYAESKDRGLDLSLNFVALSYQYHTHDRKFSLGLFGIDAAINLSDKIGLFIQGSAHPVYHYHQNHDGIVLATAGMEWKWSIAKHLKFFSREGMGIHVNEDGGITLQNSTGMGLKWQLSKRFWVRGPEVDWILARKNKDDILRSQFRFVLGISLKIGRL